MAIIIVTLGKKLLKEDFEKAKEDYSSYIKITLDIEKETAALGGEWHADAEIKLVESGGSRKNIWGGGFNLSTKLIETNAMINIKPSTNENPEILDKNIRKKFIDIAEKIFNEYIHK